MHPEKGFELGKGRVYGLQHVSGAWSLTGSIYTYVEPGVWLAAYIRMWSLVSGCQHMYVSGAWSLAGSICTCLELGVWLAAYVRVWSLESGWQHMYVSGAWSLAGSICTCLELGVWLAAYVRVSDGRIPGVRRRNSVRILVSMGKYILHP